MIVLHYWKDTEDQERLSLGAELACNVDDFLFITSDPLAYQNAENFHNKLESSFQRNKMKPHKEFLDCLKHSF